jgi:hypothetical protein
VASTKRRQELNGKIADLQTAILTARQKMLEMQDEYEKVLQESKQLKEMAIEREKLRKHQNVYWKIGNASLDGPFCPECLEHDNKLITLRHVGTMPSRIRYACTFHPQVGGTILDAIGLPFNPVLSEPIELRFVSPRNVEWRIAMPLPMTSTMRNS